MEIKEQMDKLGSAFEEFKKVNDKRLDEIKANGASKKDTEEKLAKIEKDIQGYEEKITQLNAALARSTQLQETDEQKAKKASKVYGKAFDKFMRKGDLIKPEEYHPEFKDMSVDVDVDGGFLVTPEVSSEIVKKVFESSAVRQLASATTISTDALEMLEDLDEAGAGWVGENDARPKTSSPQWNKIVIPAHELYAMPKATQKLLDDAAVNLESWLAAKVSEKFARMEATAFINGNSPVQPKGILSYASGTGFGQVERVITALNSVIAGDDLIDLQTALKEPYQANASFLINRARIGGIRKLKATDGHYIWQPGLQANVPGLLLGRPVYMTADLPSAIAPEADTIIYGDIREAYQIVDRFGIRVLRDPYTVKGAVMFYTTKRVGGGVKNFEAAKILRIAA